MSTRDLLDPEVLAAVEQFPKIDLATADLDQIRTLNSAALVMGDADEAGITRSEIVIDRTDGQPPVRCLVYTPKDKSGPLPGYFHIHGGGYILGSPEASDIYNVRAASRLGIVIVSVDYRLAPENPYPAPLDDCYTGLAYMFDNAEALGVDKTRIAIGGESAGGGLAAGLALRVRDESKYAPVFQLLVYPMIDDRTGSARPADPLVGEFIWTREFNKFGWDAFLGGAERVAPAVPARAEDLKGLPPTWMFTAQFDLFRDENIDYARRLMETGTHTELVVYPRAMHGFQMAVKSKLARRYGEDYLRALARGLGVEG